jgi:hypothetical protein
MELPTLLHAVIAVAITATAATLRCWFINEVVLSSKVGVRRNTGSEVLVNPV